MPFFTAGTTLESAWLPCGGGAVAAWLSGSGSAEKPGSLALARELAHPSTLDTALSFAGLVPLSPWRRADRSGAGRGGHETRTEQGFSRGGRRWRFCKGGFSSNGAVRSRHSADGKGLATERAGGGSARWTALCCLHGSGHGKTGQISEGLKVVNDALANAGVTECRSFEAELHRMKSELCRKSRGGRARG